MRRPLIILAGLGVAAATTGMAHAATNHVERQTYLGPQAIVAADGTTIAFLGADTPTNENDFPVTKHATGLHLNVSDKTGRAIAVAVVFYRGDLAVTDRVVCQSRDVAMSLPARVTDLRVIPLAGVCGSGSSAISTPTAGSMAVRFSR